MRWPVGVDHALHIAAIIGAGALAWSRSGWLLALAVTIVLFAIISATNAAVMSRGSLVAVRVNRWAWVAIAYALLLWLA